MAIDEENTRVIRLLLFADWPENFFSCQSEAGNSNTSGTGSVRVTVQGLVSISQWTFTTNILSTQLTTPRSPRMMQSLSESRGVSKVPKPICDPPQREKKAFQGRLSLKYVWNPFETARNPFQTVSSCFNETQRNTFACVSNSRPLKICQQLKFSSGLNMNIQ